MLYRAPLVQPKDVAWLLASYAREARSRAEDHPLASFAAVRAALQESLGIEFHGEKGERFFRSTLVQTQASARREGSATATSLLSVDRYSG